MSFNLWKKLFTKKNQQEDIELHHAGATVRHRNPFENIGVPRNGEELSPEFIDKWVVPFYMAVHAIRHTAIQQFALASNEITINDVKNLLGDFNWRMRICGAYFAAINNYRELDELIGKHLIKSEVCFAGRGYCLALATFATDKSKPSLKKYLDYYLEKKDLYFDQASAFCALEWLDKESADNLLDKWNSFVADKPSRDLENSRVHFAESMRTIKKIQEAKDQADV